MKIDALDTLRIVRVNNVMDSIYDASAELYESLMDEEYDELHKNIRRMREVLDNLEESIKDEL
jgi:PHD/YefM family antitoxin component YafN of YafNO toxin-antitoxin module